MYAVHFENEPQSDDAQQRHLAAHRAYLNQHAGRFAAAGSLAREGVDGATGGLWLVHADSELEARELVEGDPYFVHGVRRTIRVWRYEPLA
jgi:uncharacterized protein YciI